MLWIDALEGKATPSLLATLRELTPNTQNAAWPSPSERDGILTRLACSLVNTPEAPRLWLVRYGQLAGALAVGGLRSPESAEALRAIDAELGRLEACFAGAGLASSTTFVVVGDRSFAPVHTRVRPNRVLSEAGLLTPRPYGANHMVESWSAIVRSFGESAFVYSRDQQSAVLARKALERAGEENGAFRVVNATELRSLHADPEAWFGLAPEPGYFFDSLVEPPELYPARIRASDGLIPTDPRASVGFVAWGAGIRPGIEIPFMRQIDVAPTVAALLRLELPETDGRVLIGALDPAALPEQR
jgi:hypothetical protein